MSSSSWLSSVANLLVFFRWLALWLNVVLLGLSLIPFTVLALAVFALSGVAAIYNLIVGIVQYREKRRLVDGVAPVPSIAVIVLDFLVGALYLAGWILTSFGAGGTAKYSRRYHSYNYYGGFSFWEAYTTVGCLVAVHFHIFLAAVSIHIRRRQGQGVTYFVETAQTNVDIKTNDIERKD